MFYDTSVQKLQLEGTKWKYFHETYDEKLFLKTPLY